MPSKDLPFAVPLTQDIEQEWVHIIVQCLVVKEKLAQQTKALTVHLVLLAVNLKGVYAQ